MQYLKWPFDVGFLSLSTIHILGWIILLLLAEGIWGGSSLVHCRMFSSIPVFYSLDGNNNSPTHFTPVLTTRNCQMSSRGQYSPLLGTTDEELHSCMLVENAFCWIDGWVSSLYLSDSCITWLKKRFWNGNGDTLYDSLHPIGFHSHSTWLEMLFAF